MIRIHSLVRLIWPVSGSQFCFSTPCHTPDAQVGMAGRRLPKKPPTPLPRNCHRFLSGRATHAGSLAEGTRTVDQMC
ncbi:hypothetical protein F4825DRAFT_402907 [Nemania diffusa]|nr:hypothetical protein F4825DRAFT_402907 [Nemania diffusa]